MKWEHPNDIEMLFIILPKWWWTTEPNRLRKKKQPSDSISRIFHSIWRDAVNEYRKKHMHNNKAVSNRSYSADEREKVVKVRWSKQIMETCQRYIKASSNWQSSLFFFFLSTISILLLFICRWNDKNRMNKKMLRLSRNTRLPQNPLKLYVEMFYFYLSFIDALCHPLHSL